SPSAAAAATCTCASSSTRRPASGSPACRNGSRTTRPWPPRREARSPIDPALPQGGIPSPDLAPFAPKQDDHPPPPHPITPAASVAHLVGTGEDRRRDLDAERPGGSQVDHQLELGRLLHRKLGGLGALEDTVDVDGGAAIEIEAVDAVGDEAALLRKRPIGVD